MAPAVGRVRYLEPDFGRPHLMRFLGPAVVELAAEVGAMKKKRYEDKMVGGTTAGGKKKPRRRATK